jgi:ribosome-binding protein aMBF1 (putative translation factor)
MATELKGWNIPLIRAIAQSGLRFEELANLLDTSEAEIYAIARGYVLVGSLTKKKLATIIGKPESELFRAEVQ